MLHEKVFHVVKNKMMLHKEIILCSKSYSFFPKRRAIDDDNKNISNNDDDGNDGNEKQEAHYTDGPCLITDLTQFIQSTWEITYD